MRQAAANVEPPRKRGVWGALSRAPTVMEAFAPAA